MDLNMKFDDNYIITKTIDGASVKIQLTDYEASHISSAYYNNKLKQEICKEIIDTYGDVGEAFINGDLIIEGYDPEEVIEEILDYRSYVEENANITKESVDYILTDNQLANELSERSRSLKEIERD